ncbi:MAG: 30S ribosomal protein S20 [Nitrospira sp.]|nr:30S ribosomal protein S20 [Nitrospira sp.]MCP9463947.1 30S ribosomal protein S20 [Nitrospira sp.]
MAVIHKSTIRRARQAERRRERNRATLHTVKTITKKVLAAVADKKVEEAQSLLREAISTIRKAASKGVLKRNAASRRVSRLTLRVNALSGSRS